MTNLRGFTLILDAPNEKRWQWNDYRIDWEPLPEPDADGYREWGADWEYLLVYDGPKNRPTVCGFPALDAAIAHAIDDDANYTRLETFGATMYCWDPDLGARVERPLSPLPPPAEYPPTEALS